MKANDYALLSTQARQLALAVRPSQGDPYYGALTLAQWYLDRSAKVLQDLAEGAARKEPVS